MKTSHLAYSYLNYYRKSIFINDMSYNIKNMPVQINITHVFRFFFHDSYVFPSVLNEAFPLLFKQSIIMNYCVIIRTPFLVPIYFLDDLHQRNKNISTIAFLPFPRYK